MTLVRFTNIDGCQTCTQTVDFSKLRSIGVLMASPSPTSYFIRLSFDGGDTLVVNEHLSLSQAVAYRTKLEGYWSMQSVYTDVNGQVQIVSGIVHEV